MLPHEIVWAIAEWNNHNPDFYDMSQLKKSCFQHLISAAAELKMDAPRTIPVAMWLDGIPVKYDRSESLEVVTLNTPHFQQGGMTSMRIPLAALYKSHMAKNVTMDGIMRVFSWSLACLAEGCFPKYGPSGELLQGWRGKKTGQVLPPGLLVEVRGGCAAFKSTFRLPRWNDKPAIDALPITSRTTSEIAVQQLLGDLCLWISGKICGGSKTNMAIFLLFLEHQVLDPVCSQLTGSMQPTKVSQPTSWPI